jgi:hypothetical protein
MRLLIPFFFFLWATSLFASMPGAIIFSELMWMGSSASSADEWIELYNCGNRTVELGGWAITRLTSEGEQPMLELEEGHLEPGETFLIANYAADNPRSRLAISPDLVATAVSLANARLQLRLYNRQGQLIDLADDGRGTPLAGDARLKRSMVRIAFDQDGSLPASWAIAQEASGWDAESSELGTPGLIPAYLEPVSPERPGTPVHSISWAELKNRP